MKTTIIIALCVVGSLLSGVSIASNFWYGYSIGSYPLNVLYGLGGGAVDVVKVFIPASLTIAAVTIRHRVVFWAAGMAFALFSAWSIFCGYSNYVASTEGKAAGYEAAKIEHDRYSKEKPELETALSDLRAELGRTAEDVAAEIAIAERDEIFTKASRSAGCTNDTVASSKEFCNRWRQLNAELATKRSADRIKADIAEKEARLKIVKGKLDDIDLTKVEGAADPGLVNAAEAFGVALANLSTARAMGLSSVFEFGGTLAFWLAAMVKVALDAVKLQDAAKAEAAAKRARRSQPVSAPVEPVQKKRRNVTDADVVAALRAIEDGKFKSLRAYAIAHNLKIRTLQDKAAKTSLEGVVSLKQAANDQ